jgi:acyl carrier protein
MVDGLHEEERVSSRQREIEEQLRRYLIDELLDDFYDRPYDGEDPLADGEVDSLGAEQVIEYVEESFGVALDDDDIIAENFESIPALAGLIAARS